MSAEGVNRATLVGHLGQDPEIKTTPNGQAVMNLRLATTTSYLDKNNSRQERTDWHTVVVWGKRAESLAKILRKASRLYIEGRIQTRSYEKDGAKHYVTDIVADQVILLDRRGAGSGQGAEQPNGRSSPPPARDDADGDDSLPF